MKKRGRVIKAFCFLFLLILWGETGLARKATSLSIEVPPVTKRLLFLDARGTPLKALEDEDGDGRFESTLLYENGRLKELLKDRNADGSPEEIIFFDQEVRPRELRLDRNGDGRPDKWQFYRKGRLFKVEEDRDFNGRVDLKAKIGPQGKPQVIWRDEDNDGCFEIEEKLFPSRREVFVSKLTKPGHCASAKVHLHLLYQGSRLTARFFDRDLDGTFELQEFFGPQGKRCLVVEQGRERKAFFYRGGEKPIFGFRDEDGDGRFEKRFDYQQERWEAIRPLSLEELQTKCARGK